MLCVFILVLKLYIITSSFILQQKNCSNFTTRNEWREVSGKRNKWRKVGLGVISRPITELWNYDKKNSVPRSKIYFIPIVPHFFFRLTVVNTTRWNFPMTMRACRQLRLRRSKNVKKPAFLACKTIWKVITICSVICMQIFVERA